MFPRRYPGRPRHDLRRLIFTAGFRPHLHADLLIDGRPDWFPEEYWAELVEKTAAARPYPFLPRERA